MWTFPPFARIPRIRTRTRTVSLEIEPIMADNVGNQATQKSWSSRD